MTDNTQRILCGKCKIPLDGPPDGNNDTVFSCPSCGASDTRARIFEITSEQAQELAMRHLQKITRESFGGNKLVKVSMKPVPEKTYKFIIDGDLNI